MNRSLQSQFFPLFSGFLIALSLSVACGQVPGTPAAVARDASAPSASVVHASAKYAGRSSFLFGGDQYKVRYCPEIKDGQCEESLPDAEVSTETKQRLADSLFADTSKQMRKAIHRSGFAGDVTSDLQPITVAEALDVARAPEDTFLGDKVLSGDDVEKLTNYLNKNSANLILQLGDFGIEGGLGDAAVTFLVIFNTTTDFITYVTVAEYSE